MYYVSISYVVITTVSLNSSDHMSLSNCVVSWKVLFPNKLKKTVGAQSNGAKE